MLLNGGGVVVVGKAILLNVEKVEEDGEGHDATQHGHVPGGHAGAELAYAVAHRSHAGAHARRRNGDQRRT